MLLQFMQRALPALCLTALIGCSSSHPRQWEIQEILTKRPCFNGGKAILSPDSECSHLELELIRNSSGLRFYINLLYLQAPPWTEDPARTCITIQFEGQEPWIVHPYLLEGGQRLLLEGDVADFLIQTLVNEQDFTIQIGRNQIQVTSANFTKTHQRLLDLPINDKKIDKI